MSSTSRQNSRKFRFGPFEADLETGELRRNGRKVHLQEKSFQVLVALLEQRGKLVTREDLRQRLWSEDTFVDVENGLNTAISKLRDVLGDSARQLETLARRGYRFVGRVEELGQPAGTPGGSLLLELKPFAPDIVVVAMTGRIVLGPECQQIEWLTSELLGRNERKIIFDLSGVSHMDSTGVGIIVVCSGRVKDGGGELRIAGAGGLVRQILSMTKVDRIVPLYSTMTEALADWQRGFDCGYRLDSP